MKPELYTQVALTRDLPQHRLMRGDIATVIDYVPHPSGGEEGCILEVFNALGETIAVVVIELSGIETLQANEILSVRSLAT